MQACCKLFRDGVPSECCVGRVERLEALADVLSALMPLVGGVPNAAWLTAKLYAPHAAKILSELDATGQAATDAAVRLLCCCGAYASNVSCDYKQSLAYGLQLLHVRRT